MPPRHRSFRRQHRDGLRGADVTQVADAPSEPASSTAATSSRPYQTSTQAPEADPGDNLLPTINLSDPISGNMDGKTTEARGRLLEGPGSDARLRRLQMRFARLNRRSIEPASRSSWPFGLLCALTFVGVFTIGLLIPR